MGQSVHIQLDYLSIEKPFRLMGRVHDLGGTDYWTICRLSKENAILLVEKGIGWWRGEPNWTEFYRKLNILKAERDIRVAQEKLKALEERDNTE